MEWINVNDDLPPFEEKVLVVGGARGMNPQMGGNYIFITRRINIDTNTVPIDFSRQLDENQFYANHVTHWIPLPKLPKYENNNSNS